MKTNHFDEKQIKAGYYTIWRIQKPSIYLKILWEIVSTFIVFSPSVNNYMYTIMSSINDRWPKLSETERINIIAALTDMNKKGKIDKLLIRFKE